jgi:hypothetical protein
MTKRKYPREMPASYMIVDKWMAKKPFKCDKCGKQLEKNEQVVYIVTQVNRFRGDDKAKYCHKECLKGGE